MYFNNSCSKNSGNRLSSTVLFDTSGSFFPIMKLSIRFAVSKGEFIIDIPVIPYALDRVVYTHPVVTGSAPNPRDRDPEEEKEYVDLIPVDEEDIPRAARKMCDILQEAELDEDQIEDIVKQVDIIEPYQEAYIKKVLEYLNDPLNAPDEYVLEGEEIHSKDNDDETRVANGLVRKARVITRQKKNAVIPPMSPTRECVTEKEGGEDDSDDHMDIDFDEIDEIVAQIQSSDPMDTPNTRPRAPLGIEKEEEEEEEQEDIVIPELDAEVGIASFSKALKNVEAGKIITFQLPEGETRKMPLVRVLSVRYDTLRDILLPAADACRCKVTITRGLTASLSSIFHKYDIRTIINMVVIRKVRLSHAALPVNSRGVHDREHRIQFGILPALLATLPSKLMEDFDVSFFATSVHRFYEDFITRNRNFALQYQSSINQFVSNMISIWNIDPRMAYYNGVVIPVPLPRAIPVDEANVHDTTVPVTVSPTIPLSRRSPSVNPNLPVVISTTQKSPISDDTPLSIEINAFRNTQTFAISRMREQLMHDRSAIDKKLEYLTVMQQNMELGMHRIIASQKRPLTGDNEQNPSPLKKKK